MPERTKTKAVTPVAGTNQLAIAGFVLSFLIVPLGLILSIIALLQIKKTQQAGKGLAIAGIVVSAIFTLLVIMLVISTFNNINKANKAANDSTYTDRNYRLESQ